MLTLLLGCLTGPPTTTTTIYRDADHTLTLTQSREQGFLDDWVTYRLDLDAGGAVRAVHAGTLPAQRVSPQATMLPEGLVWAIRDDLCMLTGERVRCTSFADLDSPFEATTGCRDVAEGVSCTSDPASELAAGYRWVAQQRIGWRLRRGAVGALVSLDDPAASELAAALYSTFPSDAWTEALYARTSEAYRAQLAAALPERSRHDRLLIARACVPGYATLLRGIAESRGEDTDRLSRCPP